MLFLTTLLPFLLPVCAFAAPPLDPTETGGLLFKDLLCIAKTAPVVDEKPVNETAEVQRPKTTCTYQVNYKMNTYYLFGDNWNVTKDTLKASCEKGRSRVLNHWSYREWKDESGDHFCAKFNLPLASEEALEDRLDLVIAKDGWDPEINCVNHQKNGFIPGHETC